MNLRSVESFYWVVMLRSVTRAAEKLHLTQSAMSSRVATLEQELGVPLLDRRDKQFRITPAGQRFFVHAERLLALQREIKAEMGTAAIQPVVLKVGAFESASHSWLMDWVRAVHKANPMLALELTIETSPVLVDLVTRGALDMAIAALPAAGAGLRSLALPSMEMAFAGHAEHHRRRRWTPTQLAAVELITFQRGSQPHVALLDMLNRAKVRAAAHPHGLVDQRDVATGRRRARRRDIAGRGAAAPEAPHAAQGPELRGRTAAVADPPELARGSDLGCPEDARSTAC